jgi:hypothetical protein
MLLKTPTEKHVGLHEKGQLLFNFYHTGMFPQSLVKLPNVKLHDDSFSASQSVKCVLAGEQSNIKM